MTKLAAKLLGSSPFSETRSPTEDDEEFVLDLSRLKCTRGRYTGSVSVNGKEKAAYGTTGAVSNIFDEALQKVEDTLGAYFADEAEIECGKLYLVIKNGDELQVRERGR